MDLVEVQLRTGVLPWPVRGEVVGDVLPLLGQLQHVLSNALQARGTAAIEERDQRFNHHGEGPESMRCAAARQKGIALWRCAPRSVDLVGRTLRVLPSILSH